MMDRSGRRGDTIANPAFVLFVSFVVNNSALPKLAKCNDHLRGDAAQSICLDAMNTWTPSTIPTTNEYHEGHEEHEDIKVRYGRYHLAAGSVD